MLEALNFALPLNTKKNLTLANCAYLLLHLLHLYYCAQYHYRLIKLFFIGNDL